MIALNNTIKNFINKNKKFKSEDIKRIVSQVLLNQDYDKKLYQELIENNFELFKNPFLDKLSNNNIELKYFNKLLDESKQINLLYEINKFLDDGDDKTMSNIYKNIPKRNTYVRKIDLIWKNISNNNKISLDKNKINFIESNFNGNYEDYLLFIIPRITKLNEKQLDILVPEQDTEVSDIEFIDTFESSDAKITEEESIVDENEENDLEYLKILEHNINNLQSQLQNLNDKIIPRISNLENLINDVNSKVEEHQKFTKNSIEVLEQRIYKIIEVTNNTKL